RGSTKDEEASCSSSRRVEHGDILLRQRDLRGFENFGELLQAGGADDWCRDNRLGDEPSKRNLRRQRAVACGYFVDRAQDTHASRIEIALEPATAPRVFGPFLGRTVFTGQKTGRERIIVDDAKPLLPADRLELGLEFLAIGEVVQGLQTLVAGQAKSPADRKGGFQARRAHIGCADRAHLAGGN